jgi:Icc-related predicted phosphoesterase
LDVFKHTLRKTLCCPTVGIPEGDILVHCGDFFTRLRDNRYHWALQELDAFFARQPHKHKIFVPGNHEIAFRHHSADTVQRSLPHCHYLRDSGVEVEGIRFYGTPWTTSGKIIPRGLGFSTSELTVKGHWDAIPDNIDVLLTHQPPLNILDLAMAHNGPGHRACPVCSKMHSGYCHWGSYWLRETIVKRVRPKVHVFGHVHDAAGTKESEGVMFVNTAMDISGTPMVIDYHHLTVGSTSSNNTDPTDQPSVHPVQVIDKKCNAHQCSIF